MRQRSDSLLRPLVAFAAFGLIALVVLAVSGAIVVRRLATEQALEESRRLTTVSAGFVELALTNGVVPGDARSLAKTARAVLAVKEEPVVRVKLWTRDGRIVYSDELRLLDTRAPLDDEALEVIDEGGVVSELSELEGKENRFEQGLGELFEVYTRIETPDGTPLLFETYQRASAIETRQEELRSTFTPVLVVTLVVLALLQVPLAWLLARRVRSAQHERERLLQGAIEATDRERRRIAGDLHDGPVQELAGLSMRLSAAAEGGAEEGDTSEVLRDAASGVRASVRTLRSAIVGVYPPNLRTVGLEAALSDLVAGSELRGLEASLAVDVSGTSEDLDALLFRAAQEALRNAEEHAGAHRVDVAVRASGDRVVLTVADDGAGIVEGRLDEAREEGHLGLAILRDLAGTAGGELRVARGERGGTVVTMEVPRR